MPIKLILTGGTIDKDYNELNGELGFVKTHINSMLKQARCHIRLNIQQLMLIDSLQMTEQHRQEILTACQKTSSDKIIITHGTDTMVETAKALAGQIHNKTIILLGAMIPYIFKKSDALFNLGCAISAVQCLDSGIYITMNGRIFTWDNVRKNREIGRFEALERNSLR